MRAFALAIVLAAATPSAATLDPNDRAQLLGVAAQRDDRDLAARASFHLGELHERAREYALAIARYRDVLALDPGNWFANAARARIEVLESYGGAFAELARLNAVRHDPAKANDPAQIEALEREAWAFPEGRVRHEALLFVASSWARLQSPSRAVAPALAVARANGVDVGLSSAAWDVAFGALRELSDFERLDREIGRDPRAPASMRALVRRDLRRRALHRAAVAVVALGAAATLGALVEALRRGRLAIVRTVALERRALLFVVLTTLLGHALAEAWERGMGAPFLPFGAALLAVHFMVAALRGALGDRARGLRVSSGLLAAMCVLAAAYLVLEREELAGTPLLTGFGL